MRDSGSLRPRVAGRPVTMEPVGAGCPYLVGRCNWAPACVGVEQMGAGVEAVAAGVAFGTGRALY